MGIKIKHIKNYYEQVDKDAEKIHKFMSDNGYYGGQVVHIKMLGDVKVPLGYPVNVVAALQQLSKVDDIEDGVVLQMLGDLLLRLNGINPKGVILGSDEVINLMLPGRGSIKKKDKK